MNNTNINEAPAPEDNTAEQMIAALQEEVSELEVELSQAGAALEIALDRVQELEAAAPAPAGDAELQALASTVRKAQRNGHPDAAKHMDNLLIKLGA